jgi:hypothetical protein
MAKIDTLKEIEDIGFKDASQTGIDAGEKRAVEGKDKNPFRTVTETDLKTKAKFLVQGDTALDSWNKGYGCLRRNDASQNRKRYFADIPD